ncbi:MAG: tRNA (5-methylaminomethyl-2-thiouridine)(34)-methyltransferase MnmD [Hyphomicrobiales bacterium]
MHEDPYFHEIIWQENGQPYSNQFEDHFYSRAGGQAECVHVFMGGNGLPERWQAETTFTIAELGFGTGLNFLETWRRWALERTEGQHLNFVSFEAFPMARDDMGAALKPFEDIHEQAEALLAVWPEDPGVGISFPMDAQTSLRVVHGCANDRVGGWQGKADAWFLDGFAPSRNPDMWSDDLMKGVYDHTNPGGTFATYTVAGWVRRNLQDAGFEVRKAAGFGKKREMLCGVKSL